MKTILIIILGGLVVAGGAVIYYGWQILDAFSSLFEPWTKR